ncbi:hypothetical protein Ciccas_011664, partial [Cichlidogyrus casuarinus]
IQELQELDKKYREQINALMTLTSNLVSGKLKKTDFQSQETDVNAKLLNLVEKMNNVASQL